MRGRHHHVRHTTRLRDAACPRRHRPRTRSSMRARVLGERRRRLDRRGHGAEEMLERVSRHARRDFAGTVEHVSARAGRHRAGDEVFGFVPLANPTVHDGAWAELVSIHEDCAATKPAGVGMARRSRAARGARGTCCARRLPRCARAGHGARDRRGRRRPFRPARGQAGAHVIAPALGEDADLRELGATEILDRDADIESAVRERHPDGVDAVLDLVSFAPQDALLAEGGRLASTLGAAGEGEGRFNIVAQARRKPGPARGLPRGRAASRSRGRATVSSRPPRRWTPSVRNTQGKLGISVGY